MYIGGLSSELRTKPFVSFEYRLTTGHLNRVAMGTEPIAYGPYCIARLVVVRTNILARDIRTKVAIAVAFSIEHQATLLTILRGAVALGAEEKT